jgi:putative ABC transport system substrate-binding protein
MLGDSLPNQYGLGFSVHTGSFMKRREFVTLMVGAAATWPLAARAQQAGRLPTIGFLGADPTAFSPWTNAFVSRLRELGWIENRTVAIEYRWSECRTERYAEIAAEFVRMSVDVIVTVGSAVPTVRQATTTIPIVFAVGIDPVRSGLVASLAKPGGNVTGLSLQAANLAGKRIELLREVVPQLHRLGIIFNVGNAQPVLEMEDTKAAAQMLGLEVVPLEIRQAADIAPAFDTVKAQVDAIYVAAISLWSPIWLASSRLPSVRVCRPSSALAILSGPAVSCPMDRTTRICSGARPITSTRSCVEQSRATYPSSSQ